MLNKLDYKILFELDDNARQSISQISKKVGTSKQVANNHVTNLLKKGFIKKFLTILGLSKVGLALDKVYLRLIRTSLEDEKRILKFLKNHKNVAWLVRTEGVYDLAFALHTKNVEELNNIIYELEDKFGKFISEKIVNRIITGEFLHRDYLIENKKSELRKNIIFESQEEKVKLDEIDIKILSSLCNDSRVSSIQISKKVKISADAVSKRIKRLEKSNVIRNYILVLDNEKLNLLHYKVLLKIGNFDQKKEKEFLDFCKAHKNITFYNKSIGSWEIEIDLEVEKSKDFREVMRALKQKFADSTKEYFSLIIYDIQKFNFLPMENI
jgi:DNA-binding Lrp family transcriptional regulator